MLTRRSLEKSRKRGQVRPSMEIQILLPEDTSVPTESLPVRHCGDEIQGSLQVVTCCKFDFEIYLAFEGFVRTWTDLENERNLTHLPPTKEFRFLHEIQKLSSHPSTPSCENDLHMVKLPFRFVVPYELISARSDLHPVFLNLCPSTRAGLVSCGPMAGMMNCQPMIIYMIRIKRIRTDIALGLVTKPTPPREIVIMPQAAAAPPVAMESFPGEYRSSITKFLKQHSWSRPVGKLQISALEPSPLNLFSTPRPSTVVNLNLVFTSNYPRDFNLRPHKWTYVVKTYLRILTFYSSQEFARIPTLIAAKTNPNLKFCENSTTAEIREYNKILLNDNFKSLSVESEASEGEECCLMASLTVPVSTTQTLLPTFQNILSTRRYALVVRLNIKEVNHGTLELILPVQLIYDPLNDRGFREHQEQWNDIQDDILSSVFGYSDSLSASEVNQEDPGQIQDSSPPPYDL